MKKIFETVYSKANKILNERNIYQEIALVNNFYIEKDIKKLYNFITANYPDFIKNIPVIFNPKIFLLTNKISNFENLYDISNGKLVIEILKIYILFKKLFAKYDVHLKNLFYHNTAVGICCGIISLKDLTVQTEDFNIDMFLSGFFHNFGKMLMILVEKGLYYNIFEEAINNNYNFFEIENKIYGYSLQTLLASSVIRDLKYDEKIYLSLEFYRDFNNGKYRKESSLIHISDIFATALCIGETGDYKLPELDFKLLDYYKLDSNKLKNLFKEFVPRLATITDFFEGITGQKCDQE